MYLINTYLDFSFKYKIIVGDNLNEDIKKIIWKIYIKLIANDIIKNFLKKKILRCRDCNTPNWNLTLGNNQTFYYVNACDHELYYFTDIPCCMKYICIKDCKFKLKCEHCNNINKYILERNNNDIGWNPIEGKENIIFNCKDCNSIIEKELAYNKNIHKYTIGNII